jgi:hypothetical protein
MVRKVAIRSLSSSQVGEFPNLVFEKPWERSYRWGSTGQDHSGCGASETGLVALMYSLFKEFLPDYLRAPSVDFSHALRQF